MPKTVSDKILDAAIRDQVNILRLSETEKLKAEKLLVNMRGDLIKELSKSDPTGTLRTAVQKQRLKDLYKSVDTIVQDNFKTLSSTSKSALTKMGSYEAGASNRMVNDAIGIEVMAPELTAAKVKSVVSKSMIDGQLMGDWWAGQATEFTERFKDTMDGIINNFQSGMLKGQALGQMISAVSAQGALMGYTRNNVDAMVRTSYMQVAADIRQEVYEKNRDILRGTEWVSVLDLRTTPICRALDGQVWDMDGKPIGRPGMRYHRPPAHWRCRSTTVPVVLPYEEMVNVKPQIKELSPAKRASMNGKVSGDLSFEDWFGTLPEADQIDMLGPGKYKLFKKHKLSMPDMLRMDGSPITIKELNARIAGKVKANPLDIASQPIPKRLEKDAIKYADKGAKKLVADKGAIEWKPEMSAAELKSWAKGSKIPDKIYMQTTEDAAKAILSEGIDPAMTSSRSWQGSGGYFSSVKFKANRFGPVDLEARVNVKNPFVGTVEQVEAKVAELRKGIKAPFVVTPDGKTLDVRAWMNKNDELAAITKAWKKEGFDSVIMTGDGGDVILVFDRNKIAFEKAGKAKKVVKPKKVETMQSVREQAEADYNKALVDYQATSYKTKNSVRDKLRKDVFDKEMFLISVSDKAEIAKMRKLITDKMINSNKSLSPYQVKMARERVEEGTAHIPYDVLRDMERNGVNFNFSNKKKFRAYYSNDAFRECWFYVYDDSGVIMHESAHAIDAMFSGRVTGQVWKDGAFVTKQDGKNFRKWYNSKITGEKGKYTNGDGFYDKDNWIDSYEGRIYANKYTGEAIGVGDEYWSMNLQYFHDYKQKVALHNKKIINAESKLLQIRNFILEPDNKSSIPYLLERERIEALDLANLRMENVEHWAARNSRWAQAKAKSPDLTKFIEDNFGQELWNDYLPASQKKNIGKLALEEQKKIAEAKELAEKKMKDKIAKIAKKQAAADAKASTERLKTQKERLEKEAKERAEKQKSVKPNKPVVISKKDAKLIKKLDDEKNEAMKAYEKANQADVSRAVRKKAYDEYSKKYDKWKKAVKDAEARAK